jgi:hypothetical protein
MKLIQKRVTCGPGAARVNQSKRIEEFFVFCVASFAQAFFENRGFHAFMYLYQ